MCARIRYHCYSVYIVTNPTKTVLYTGVTNDLSRRLAEHYFNRDTKKSFAGKYRCYNLVYFEQMQYVKDAIMREKEIKGWLRKKKELLIESENPEWRFLNNEVMNWPPKEELIT